MEIYIALDLGHRISERGPWRGGGAARWAGGPWSTQNCGWVGHGALGPTNNWPVCSLIIGKMSKMSPDVRF